jgi:hypothetical protein
VWQGGKRVIGSQRFGVEHVEVIPHGGMGSFWVSMKRRHFLIGAAATAARLLTPDTSRSQSDIGPHLAVSYEDSGQAKSPWISSDSAMNRRSWLAPIANASTLGLIRSLGENSVIRIGGNTSERTMWGVDARAVGPPSLVVAPANIDRLAAALRVLGWKLIMD